MNKQKPAYCFKGEDFIPIVGMNRHVNRSATGAKVEEMRTGGDQFSPDSDYFVESFGRDILLVMYNSVLLGGSFVGGLAGLAKLLFK